MGVLSLKYKAHKMVNILFYGVVFLIGFLMGFLGNKVDFNKLINQVLFIDNVSALTTVSSGTVTYEDDNLNMTSSNFNTEEYIYNIFNYVVEQIDLNISFYDFYNVFAFNYNNSSSEGIYYFSNSDWYYYSNNNNNKYSKTKGNVLRIKYYPSSIGSKTFEYYYGINEDASDYQTMGGGSNYYVFSTQDFTGSTKFINVLDFSDYTLKLEFNENLFKDNEDFKQVCIENGSSYAITRIDNPENLEYMTDYDYIWFPYKFNINDIKMFNFSNANDEEIYFKEDNMFIPVLSFDGEVSTRNNDNVFEFTDLSYHFYDSKEKIDNVFNDEILGGNLNYKGYIDKYSYYGWSSLLFNIWFDYRDGNDFNFFPIITFNITSSTISFGSSNTIHGGGGLSIPFDEEIEDIKNYCFYIKNDYVVTKVQLDEFSDVDGNVPTQNGDFQFSTSKNENNISSGGLMSQVNDFISRIRDVIDFIRINIYNFYLSMPLLVRMFFSSVLVILIIGLIIRMVVR